MTLLFFLTMACTNKEATTIKEDTKMRLWFARNTVLLFAQCNKSLGLKEDSTQEESQAALEKQKKLCDKYHEKEKQLINICTKEVLASINSKHAPIDDPEYQEAKDELLKICAVIESKNKK